VESKLGPLSTSATHWPIVPAPGDCEDGEFGEMSGRGNRSTRRKPAPTPLCPPQIPLDHTRNWTQAAAVGRQLLTASAMARPIDTLRFRLYIGIFIKCLIAYFEFFFNWKMNVQTSRFKLRVISKLSSINQNIRYCISKYRLLYKCLFVYRSGKMEKDVPLWTVKWWKLILHNLTLFVLH
jgi:hypothetical protein